MTQTPRTNFLSPDQWRLHTKLGFNLPSGFGDVWKCWQTTDGRRSISILLAHLSAFGSGKLKINKNTEWKKASLMPLKLITLYIYDCQCTCLYNTNNTVYYQFKSRSDLTTNWQNCQCIVKTEFSCQCVSSITSLNPDLTINWRYCQCIVRTVGSHQYVSSVPVLPV